MRGKFILHSLCPLGDKGPDVFPPLVRWKSCILMAIVTWFKFNARRDKTGGGESLARARRALVSGAGRETWGRW